MGHSSAWKRQAVEIWGYSVEDAHWLQEEIERQGRAHFLSGNYTLGKLNLFGQRLNIRVEIPRKDGRGVVSFITGWPARLMEKLNFTRPMEVPKMKELDCVEVIVDKKRYSDVGIYKGMHGWICDERKIDGRYLVNFPQYGEKEDIATLDILESDLLKIPVMDARINERIRRQYKGIRR